MPDTRATAERIVEALFTSGYKERADRLVLTIDGPPKYDLGGWCRAAAVDVVERVLRDGGK